MKTKNCNSINAHSNELKLHQEQLLLLTAQNLWSGQINFSFCRNLKVERVGKGICEAMLFFQTRNCQYDRIWLQVSCNEQNSKLQGMMAARQWREFMARSNTQIHSFIATSILYQAPLDLWSACQSYGTHTSERSHRIIKSFGLEETFKGHWVQPPVMSRDIFS